MKNCGKGILSILTTSFYDINKKILTKIGYFQNFSWILFSIYKMHDNMHWHCSKDYCVKLSLVGETFAKKLLSFHREMVSAWPLGKCSERRTTNKCKNSCRKIFENAIYVKSRSKPLNFSKKKSLLHNQMILRWLWLIIKYIPWVKQNWKSKQ